MEFGDSVTEFLGLADVRDLGNLDADRRRCRRGRLPSRQRCFFVNDRRAEPFEKRRIGFSQQFEGLSPIPPADVEFIVYRPFDNIAFIFNILSTSTNREDADR